MKKINKNSKNEFDDKNKGDDKRIDKSMFNYNFVDIYENMSLEQQIEVMDLISKDFQALNDKYKNASKLFDKLFELNSLFIAVNLALALSLEKTKFFIPASVFQAFVGILLYSCNLFLRKKIKKLDEAIKIFNTEIENQKLIEMAKNRLKIKLGLIKESELKPIYNPNKIRYADEEDEQSKN